MRREPELTPPVRPIALIFTLVVALLLGACDAAPSNTTASSPGGSSSTAPTDVPGTSPEPSGSGEPSQTDTEWGRIWDALPASFPNPPGSTPSEPVGRGPSSGELTVGAAAADVAGFYETALGAAGYSSSRQGPLEDGSLVFDGASAVAGCKLQVTVTPLSGVTHVTILFGAACPFR